jgi:hypothetical protein
MNASILPRLRLLGVASVLALAATATMAQTEEKPQAPAKASTAAKAQDAKSGGAKTGEAKTGEKPAAGAKKPAKPAGPAGYASESEARARCKGEVVWVDKDHFYHYAGSREYGRKPGAFTCERN